MSRFDSISPKTYFLITLFLAGITSAAQAAMVVDFSDNKGSRINAFRASDSGGGAFSTETWNFSDSIPLSTYTDPETQNTIFYGGLTKSTDLTGGLAALVNDQEVFFRNKFRLRYTTSRENLEVHTKSFSGAFIWNKHDFLANQSEQLGFSDSSSLSISVATSLGDTRELRFIVKQGGDYYVSNSVETKSDYSLNSEHTFSINDFDTETWALLDTADYSYGEFASVRFNDIEAVGIYMNYSNTGDGSNPAQLEFKGFQADVDIPEPATAALLIVSVSGVFSVMRRRRR